MNDDHTREADVELLAAVRAEVIRASEDPPLDVDAEARFAEEGEEPGAQEVTRSGRQLLAEVERVRQLAHSEEAQPPAEVAAVVDDPPPGPLPPPVDEPATPARWSPPPRLKPAPTPRAAPVLIDAPRPARHVWRWVLGALLAAALTIAVLLSVTGGGGDDEPPPGTGDVPSSSTTAVGT
jgi:hypothetical protein